MQFNNGTHHLASGTLVGEKSVLTAARNLYDRHYDRVVQTVSFLPGSSDNPLEASNARHVIIPESYIKAQIYEESAENDIALVTLDKPLGSHFGYLDLKAFSAEEDKYLTLVGYDSYLSSTTRLYSTSGEVIESHQTRKVTL